MKCENCPLSNNYYLYYEGYYEWECLIGHEDEMNEDDDGCDITEEEANRMADNYVEEEALVYADMADWLLENQWKEGDGE